MAREDVRRLEAVRHVTRLRSADATTSRRLERGAHDPAALEAVVRSRRHHGAHTQQTRAVGDAQIGVAVHVREVGRWTGFEPHAAVQTRHPPLVLVLDVALRAVAHHHDGEVVGAGTQVLGDVVLAR